MKPAVSRKQRSDGHLHKHTHTHAHVISISFQSS